MKSMMLPFNYLVVDDSPQDQLLAREAFEHLCPECILTCAGSGLEALTLLQSRNFHVDVVLLDLNMPGMSGFDLLREMKQDPRLVRIPVVILSTSSAQQDISEAYTLHASSYLVKSSSFAEFLSQIEKFLDYWQSSRTVNHVG